jgi:hypothetical protein
MTALAPANALLLEYLLEPSFIHHINRCHDRAVWHGDKVRTGGSIFTKSAVASGNDRRSVWKRTGQCGSGH